jgi:hypothetical protein
MFYTDGFRSVDCGLVKFKPLLGYGWKGNEEENLGAFVCFLK